MPNTPLSRLAYRYEARRHRQLTKYDIGVHFSPSYHEVVEAILELAAPSPGDFLMDLGSGDGRIVHKAALKYECPGLGIDANPFRVRIAALEGLRLGLSDLVKFEWGDLFNAPAERATILTMFLQPTMTQKVLDNLMPKLPIGGRVVSFAWDYSYSPSPDARLQANDYAAYLWTRKE